MRRSLIRLQNIQPNGSPQATKVFGFERASESVFKPPCIILVSPALDRNVGSVARAMLNFGMHELRVVSPECDIRSEVAIALSSGADKVLQNAKVYSDLRSCIADLSKVMSTTVRPRHQNHMVYTPTKAAEVLINHCAVARTGIVFGREHSGLTNEEVSLSDSILTIPTFPHFPSINLAQSVNIVCYEMWKQRLELESQSPPTNTVTNLEFQRKAKKEDLEIFINRVEGKLREANYRHNEGARARQILNVRTFFQRIELCNQELRMLHGVVSSLTRDDKRLQD